MANLCSNWVSFDGPEDKIKECLDMYRQLATWEQETNKKQYPPFIKPNELDRYIFDIIINDDGHTMQYSTDWAQNTSDLLKVADYYGLGFTSEYEELSAGVYGRTIYKDGKIKVYDLDDEDLAQYEEDEDTDTYLFRGEEFDSQYDILEILIDEKVKKEIDEDITDTNENNSHKGKDPE